MTNLLPNHLNIKRQIEGCPSAIGSTVSQRIAPAITQVIIQQPDSG